MTLIHQRREKIVRWLKINRKEWSHKKDKRVFKEKRKLKNEFLCKKEPNKEGFSRKQTIDIVGDLFPEDMPSGLSPIRSIVLYLELLFQIGLLIKVILMRQGSFKSKWRNWWANGMWRKVRVYMLCQCYLYLKRWKLGNVHWLQGNQQHVRPRTSLLQTWVNIIHTLLAIYINIAFASIVWNCFILWWFTCLDMVLVFDPLLPDLGGEFCIELWLKFRLI